MGIAKSSSLRGITLSLLLLAMAPSTTFARQLIFSTTVPTAQVSLLKKDLGTDITLANDPVTQSVMVVPDLSDSSLREWLSERVGYIIGENESDAKRLLAGQKIDYENPGVLPDFEMPNKNVPPPTTTDSNGGKHEVVATVMANVGLSYYYMGKEKGILVGYKFSAPEGVKIVPMVSPRVGIIQVGEGLFGIVPEKSDKGSIVNTWFRLSTLFHEAHHSDGNGKSLGFPHAVCPKGSVYYNYNACDREKNGAYAVGALVLKQSLITCTANQTCSAAEQAKLKALALDSFSRILAQTVLDPKPESVVAGVGSAN